MTTDPIPYLSDDYPDPGHPHYRLEFTLHDSDEPVGGFVFGDSTDDTDDDGAVEIARQLRPNQLDLPEDPGEVYALLQAIDGRRWVEVNGWFL